ncbi:SMK killer toxin resistance protein [Exophiala xenobiotica]|uniref:SMK killer toxin resistance protein n=1 Tax=Lithohypha guttulata TaxID=1690604 RepID=A0ABR0KDN3_9EURO|nr:SMK killer toxin resistance protein [Lithohypha guttulata]KAK5327919.1 SMK killer toxin resistance protein [Exophiala xenobiotica]
MTTFLEDLWGSIFTPGTTPTLLIATNASFAALQFVLLLLLLATYSIHFLVLSILSAALWYAINWFAQELQIEHARAAAQEQQNSREKSQEPGSDTETEIDTQMPLPKNPSPSTDMPTATGHLQATLSAPDDDLRRRRSLGDSSGYVSTDSEWEQVSEGGSKI